MKLEGIIGEADFLTDSEKDFLISRVEDLNAMQKLRMQGDIQAKRKPAMLSELVIKRQEFIEQEAPEPDPIGDFIAKFVPKKNQDPISISILSQARILGSQPPQAIKNNALPIKSIAEMTEADQLQYITPKMIEASNEKKDPEHEIKNMLEHVDKVMLPLNVVQRRVHLLDYIRSPLYTAYINTGLAGLRHPELKPSVLNTLYQINEGYLPTKQFTTAAQFTTHIRVLCGL